MELFKYKIIFLIIPLFLIILYCNQQKNLFSDNMVLNVELENNEDLTFEFNKKNELFCSIENERFVLSTLDSDKALEIYFELPAKKNSEYNYFLNKDIKFSSVITNGKKKEYFVANKILNFSLNLKKLKNSSTIAEGFFSVQLQSVNNRDQYIKINGNFELKLNDKMIHDLAYLNY